MEVLTDRNGRYLRVTVECQVLNVPEIVGLQQALKEQILEFKPKGKSDLHLTVFHFGKPHELYRELKAKNLNLKNRDFWQYPWQLMADCDELINRKFELSSRELAVLGNKKNPVLALEFSPPKWLAAKRASAEKHWEEFLQNCEVEPHKLANNKPFRPHLSLGRTRPKASLIDLEPVLVQLAPSRLRNVK